MIIYAGTTVTQDGYGSGAPFFGTWLSTVLQAGNTAAVVGREKPF